MHGHLSSRQQAEILGDAHEIFQPGGFGLRGASAPRGETVVPSVNRVTVVAFDLDDPTIVCELPELTVERGVAEADVAAGCGLHCLTDAVSVAFAGDQGEKNMEDAWG
jgi:hypothetical protein